MREEKKKCGEFLHKRKKINMVVMRAQESSWNGMKCHLPGSCGGEQSVCGAAGRVQKTMRNPLVCALDHSILW